MVQVRQLNFSSGELAPSLYGRVDQSRYASGLRKCRNFIVNKSGGVSNRAGTRFLAVAKQEDNIRLIPFIFSTSDAYVLELGNLYMRFYRNSALITETAKVIVAATQATPAVITSTAHGYSNGNRIIISGVSGMTQLNNREFTVAGATANTFELSGINSVLYDAYTSGGTAARIVEIATPYLDTDLPALKFAQSNDVMTLVHPSYAPRELARYSHTVWNLTEMDFYPSIEFGLIASTVGTVGTRNFRYSVIGIDQNGKLTTLGHSAVSTITNITQADPAVVTTASAHGYVTGDEVYIGGVVGMVQINRQYFKIEVNGVNTFKLLGANSTSYTAYTAGGSARFPYTKSYASAIPTSTAPNVVSWDLANVGLVQEFLVYRSDDGFPGFIGSSNTSTFNDIGYTPDTTDTIQKDFDPFLMTGDFPSCVTYYQQRQVFGGSNNHPATIYPSKIGDFDNFSKRAAGPQADDAFNFILVGRRLNKIVDMVDIGKLIAFTSDGEWAVNGGDAGQLIPTDINARQHTYNGSSILSPMVANGSVLYVQERGAIVRDLLFDFQVDGYTGSDLTTFSSHLFQGFELVDSAYQKTPHSVAWYVRDDGILLGCTYNREHQIVGWVHCDFSREADTTAEVRNVCVIPEGDEDVLYVAVNRSLGTYIERFETRQINDVTLSEFVTASGDVNDTATFMDSYLAYDGRNATLSKTATLSGGTNWDENETLTLTMSAILFTTGTVDVGREVWVEDSDGVVIRCAIESVSSTTVATIRPNRTVPASIRSVATNVWAFAAKTVTGLWHLNGEEVSVVGNGYVVANPNDDNYDVVTVTLGSVTLPENYTVIQVGLPFVSDLETLDIDTVQGETLMGKKKLITEITIFTDQSRGIWVGEELPETDDSHEGLFRPRSRDQGSGPDTIPGYFDDPVSVNIKATWNLGGRIVVRQTDPLPISLLSISPTGYIPLRGGA